MISLNIYSQSIYLDQTTHPDYYKSNSRTFALLSSHDHHKTQFSKTASFRSLQLFTSLARSLYLRHFVRLEAVISMDAPFLTSFFVSGPAGLPSSQLPLAALSLSLALSLFPRLQSTLKPIISPFLASTTYFSRSPQGHLVHVPSSHPATAARSDGPQFFSPPLRRFSSRSSRDFSVY